MAEEVQRMFDRIARRYDRANTVLSAGQDRRWRRVALRMSGVAEGDDVLDVACGTGALTRVLAQRVGPTGSVVGVDFAPRMLEVARAHPPVRGAPVAFGRADAMELPFDDGRFDAATIAFGIRNVDEPVRGLAEMARVVRPGGTVTVLEFGQAKGPVGATYRLYARHVMPRLGGWLTGDRQAYEYLPRTVAAFPAGPAFEDLMHRAHPFVSVRSRRLLGGLVWCYTGTTRS